MCSLTTKPLQPFATVHSDLQLRNPLQPLCNFIAPLQPSSTLQDSFFDEISCEALDRKSGGRGQYTREMRDAQRQVDIETFGKMSLDSSRGDSGYKGGYRGGKGKGMGYKGSGGKGMGY